MINYQGGVSHTLDIKMEFHKGILFVELNGDLNIDTCDELKHNVIDVFDGISSIVYDLSKIKKIDNHGINLLKLSDQICRKNNGKALIIL